MVIFVKKRPEITSKHLYFDRDPGKRLYSNLYLKNIDEFCLFCTLYLKKIDEVQVHGTFVLEMKIDLKYNLGYRMSKNIFGNWTPLSSSVFYAKGVRVGSKPPGSGGLFLPMPGGCD